MANRIGGADGIRAIACIWVIVGHIYMYLPRHHLPSSFPWSLGYHGHMGVAMFFVLSGFLLAQPFWRNLRSGNRMPSVRVYALRRLARILPGFWFCAIVTAAASGAIATRWEVFGLVLTLGGVNCLLPGTYQPPFNRPLWSISIELWFYVMLPLVMFLVFRARRRGLVIMGGVIVVLVAGQAVFLRAAPQIEQAVADPALFASESMVVHHNPFALFTHFLLGALAAWALVAMQGRRITPTCKWCNRYDAICAGLLIALIATRGLPGQWLGIESVIPFDWPVFSLIIAVLLALLPLSAVTARCLDNALFRAAALLSFGLYLWHVPVLRWFQRLWELDDSSTLLHVMGYSTTAIATTLVIAAASYLIIERPFIRWAQRQSTPRS